MSPEEKLASLLQRAGFQNRPLSARERLYFELRLRRVQQRWKSEWQQITVIMGICYGGCLLGIWFSKDVPWWGAFFFLGLIVVAGTMTVLKDYWPFHFRQREINALLESGSCDDLLVITNEVWVIENLQYGTCWYVCALNDARVILIDGGQYDFSPRLPAKEFSLRVYKLANGNIVEPRLIPYGERMPPAREYSCGFTNTILDQGAYTYSGTLQSFCDSMREAGIDLEETCPAKES